MSPHKIKMFGESSLGKLLPRDWFSTDHTRIPINKISVLVCVYFFTIAATMTTFAMLFIYYQSVKIEEVRISTTILEGWNCSALRKDDYYGKIFTEKTCMENYSPLSIDSLHCSNTKGCVYYPFGENFPEYNSDSSNCQETLGDYAQWRVPINTQSACLKWTDSDDGTAHRGLIGPIDLPRSFNLDTECPGFSSIYGSSSSCLVEISNYGSESYAILEPASCSNTSQHDQGIGDGCRLVSPFFDESDYSDYSHCDLNNSYEGGLLITDGRLIECEAYRKQCMLLALPTVLDYQDEERNCHPCSAFKENTPFLCERQKDKEPLETLSLATANTSAVLGILTTLFAILLRSKTFMEDYRKGNF